LLEVAGPTPGRLVKSHSSAITNSPFSSISKVSFLITYFKECGATYNYKEGRG
jgi:hypothetical protein